MQHRAILSRFTANFGYLWAIGLGGDTTVQHCTSPLLMTSWPTETLPPRGRKEEGYLEDVMLFETQPFTSLQLGQQDLISESHHKEW